MKERLVYLDYARVFCAFLVIYGHLYAYNPDNYVRVVIYFFHMPFFFLISGMLHSYRGGEIQLKKYAKTLLIPMVFFSVFSGLVIGTFYHFFTEKDVCGDTLIQTLCNHFYSSFVKMFKGKAFLSGPCWFLWVLFFCKIITDIIQKNRIIGTAITLILFCISLKHFRYLFIGNIGMAMPIYLFGFYFKDRIKDIVYTKTNPAIYILLIAVFVAIIYKLKVVSMFGVNYGHIMFPLNLIGFWINGLIGSYFVLKVSSIFDKETYYSKIAYSLITILGLQFPIFIIPQTIYGTDWNYFLSIPIALVILFICHYSHKLIEKYIPFVLGKF